MSSLALKVEEKLLKVTLALARLNKGGGGGVWKDVYALVLKSYLKRKGARTKSEDGSEGTTGGHGHMHELLKAINGKVREIVRNEFVE